MNRTRVMLSVLFCVCLALSGLAKTQTPAGTNVITLSVLVVEPADRPVTGLSAKDFRVLENDIEQKIVSLKENNLAGDYSLTYTPSNPTQDGTWRKVRLEIVNLQAARLTVRHAAGYYARQQ
jgi:hypothetical protein